jgi:hypothetical protein
MPDNPTNDPEVAQAVDVQDFSTAETVNVQDLPSEDRLTKNFSKEVAAEKVAGKIIVIFGGTILGVLFLDFVTIWVLLRSYGCEAEKLGEVVTKGIVPLITATSTLGSTVFAPLLAFVLGYYFSEKKGSG